MVTLAQIVNAYDADRGLAQGFVSSIIQDREGYLWVGTNNGLSRFDGTRFKNFRAKTGAPNTLQSNKIHQLLQDSDGRLWVVNGETLQWYDANTGDFHTPDYFKGRQLADFKNAYFDKENRLWVLAQDSLFCLSKKRAAVPNELQLVGNWTLPKEILGRSRAFLVDTGLILGSENGLWTCGFSGTDLKPFPGTATWNITHLCPDKYPSDFWVQTRTGTGLWHNSRWTWFDGIKGSFFLKYEGIYYQNKTYLLGKRAIYEWDGTQLSVKADNLPFEVISGCADAQGNLWLGSNAKGLFQFNLRQHLIQPFWAGKMISEPVFKQKDGTLLGHVEDKWQTAVGKGLDPSALNVCLDPQGVVWYWRGDQTLQNATGTVVWKCPRLKPDQKLLRMRCLPNGCFVLVQGRKVLFLEAHTGKSLYLDDEAIPKQMPWGVLRLNSIKSDGHYVWLGTDDGLVRVALDWDKAVPDCVHYNQDSGLPAREVLALAPDPARSAVWAGTLHGLYKFSPETRRAEQIATPAIKPDETVYCLQQDLQGRLWLGTNAGLKMYDPTQGQSAWFSVADGLPASEFNRNTEFLGSDGEVLMGTVSGAIRFYPERLLVGVAQTKTVVSEVLLNDTFPCTLGKPLIHCTQSDRLTIHFSNLDFAPIAAYQYRHRLLGLSDGWTAGSSDASVTFAHLPAGRYVFEVSSSTGKADWGPPARIDIEVAHTPAERAKQLALACLAILALGFAVWHYYRTQKPELSEKPESPEPTEALAAPPILEHTEAAEASAFRDAVLQLIAENFRDSNFNTQSIQEKINISKAQLHRRMVAEAGNTAAHFLKKRRLEEALEMLRDRPDMTISEVAYACGFSDPNYFSTAFSANFGESPKKYREHLRG